MLNVLFRITPFLIMILSDPVYAGNLETTLKNVQHKLTGDIAIIIGAVFIAVAGYRMFVSKAAGSSVVVCLVAAVVIIKSEDIIRWITGSL